MKPFRVAMDVPVYLRLNYDFSPSVMYFNLTHFDPLMFLGLYEKRNTKTMTNFEVLT